MSDSVLAIWEFLRSDETLSALLAVIAGWTLGIGSTLGMDTLRRRSRHKSYRKTLAAELDLMVMRATFTAFHTASRFGDLSRKDVDTFVNSLGCCSDAPEAPEMAETLRNLQKQSDREFDRWRQEYSDKKGASVTIPPLESPVLSFDDTALQLFPPETVGKILDLRANIGFLNEQISATKTYHLMTFDSNLSRENYDAVAMNEKRATRRAGERSALISGKALALLHLIRK